MPRLVEDVGEPLFAGWLSRVYRLTGKTHGVRWVCGRRVFWKLHCRVSVAVTHPPADASAEPLSYSIPLLFTDLPSGGSRWWWKCPECVRRVDVLYLPEDRDKLACRRCCGLHYRSQYSHEKTRRSKRRPTVRAVRFLNRWVWLPPCRK